MLPRSGRLATFWDGNRLELNELGPESLMKKAADSWTAAQDAKSLPLNVIGIGVKDTLESAATPSSRCSRPGVSRPNGYRLQLLEIPSPRRERSNPRTTEETRQRWRRRGRGVATYSGAFVLVRARLGGCELLHSSE